VGGSAEELIDPLPSDVNCAASMCIHERRGVEDWVLSEPWLDPGIVPPYPGVTPVGT
jgi:hypothetical protein